MNIKYKIKYNYSINQLFGGYYMIFNAIVIPTPRRIRRFVENKIDELTCESITKENIENKEIEHINATKDVFKNFGLSIKIF